MQGGPVGGCVGGLVDLVGLVGLEGRVGLLVSVQAGSVEGVIVVESSEHPGDVSSVSSFDSVVLSEHSGDVSSGPPVVSSEHSGGEVVSSEHIGGCVVSSIHPGWGLPVHSSDEHISVKMPERKALHCGKAL